MESDKSPRVSVIMGIYKSEDKEIVKQAIKSIINQSFKHWEFVICDDGSPDDTWEFLNSEYGADSKFVLIKNDQNGGLRVALNACLKVAVGKYIVRQDADDYSRKDRLEILVDFMDKHIEYACAGSGMVIFNENGAYAKRVGKSNPTKLDFVKGTRVAHATSIFRKEAFDKVGGYRVAFETMRCEDYDLFMRIYAMGLKAYNIQDTLYFVREDQSAYKRKKYLNRVKEAIVRFKGYRGLKVPIYCYIYVLKPLIIGLVPVKLMYMIKKGQRKGEVIEQ